MLMNLRNFEDHDVQSFLNQEKMTLSDLLKHYPRVTTLFLEHFRLLSNPAVYPEYAIYQHSYHALIEAIDHHWESLALDHKRSMFLCMDRDKIKYFFSSQRVAEVNINLEECPMPFRYNMIILLHHIKDNPQAVLEDDVINALSLCFRGLKKGLADREEAVSLLIECFTLESREQWESLVIILTSTPCAQEGRSRFQDLEQAIALQPLSLEAKQSFLCVVMRVCITHTLGLSAQELFEHQDLDFNKLQEIYQASYCIPQETNHYKNLIFNQIVESIKSSGQIWRAPLNPTPIIPDLPGAEFWEERKKPTMKQNFSSRQDNEDTPKPAQWLPISGHDLLKGGALSLFVASGSLLSACALGGVLIVCNQYKKINYYRLSAMGYSPYDTIIRNFTTYWNREEPLIYCRTYSIFLREVTQELQHLADDRALHLNQLPEDIELNFMHFHLSPSLRKIRDIFFSGAQRQSDVEHSRQQTFTPQP